MVMPPDGSAGSVLGVIIDRAIYRDGQRVAEPQDPAQMAAICDANGGIALYVIFKRRNWI